MITRANILMITFFISATLIAQEQDIIYGKVISELNNQALPFANIAIKNHYIGISTNQDGDFVIKIPELNSNDTLVCSFLGFRTKEIPISNIQDSITISLKPKKYLINEVIVEAKNPKKIVLKALENIDNNYNNLPFNMTAFYRERIKENNDEIQFSEAILKIYKSSVSKNNDKDRIKLIKGHTKPNLKNSILWNYIRFIDGPYDLLKADIAKNTKDFFTVSQNKLNFLLPRNFKLYDYTLLESFDDNETYAIKFAPKAGKKRVIYDGIIFIDKQSMAIKGIEYNFNSNKINLAHIIDFETQLSLQEAGAILKAVDFSCYVKYRPINDLWVFSQANISYNFIFNETLTKELLYISAYSNLVVTEIETQKVEKFKFRDQLKIHTTLQENIKEIDATFWENYNYIQHEEN